MPPLPKGRGTTVGGGGIVLDTVNLLSPSGLAFVGEVASASSGRRSEQNEAPRS